MAILSAVVLAVFLGSSVGFGAETHTFRLALEMSVGHPYYLGAKKFDELLREKTGGRAEVEIFPNGQLGTQRDTAEACAMGGLDFAMTMTSILEAYDQRMEAISMAFVFRDWDHVFKVVDGKVGEKLNSFVEPKGIVVVANFMNGTLHPASRKIPIKGPEDMKGIKLRCQQAKTMIEFGKALGSVVTPMPYGEIFTALQLGTIDAEIQNLNNVLFDKHYEVLDYINELAPFYYLEPLLMSRDVLKGLPADMQKAIFEAAKGAAEWQRNFYLNNYDDFVKQLKEHGITFLSSSPEPWKKALEINGYYNVFAQHKELIDEISAVK